MEPALSMTTTTATALSQRQKDLLSAAALDMVAAIHPPGSRPHEGYFRLAHATWESLGEWTAAELDEALFLASQLPPVVE